MTESSRFDFRRPTMALSSPSRDDSEPVEESRNVHTQLIARTEYGRSAGVTALALLAAWAEVPRESIVAWFLWLAQEGLEREPSQVWNSLAAGSADIEALPLFPELRRAYDDGLIEPQFMNPSELDHVEAAPRGSVLEATRERHPPSDDVVGATAWWGRLTRRRDRQRPQGPTERAKNRAQRTLSLREWQEVQEVLRPLRCASRKRRTERDRQRADSRRGDVEGGQRLAECGPAVRRVPGTFKCVRPSRIKTGRSVDRGERNQWTGFRRDVIDPHLAVSTSEPPVSRRIERGSQENSAMILCLGVRDPVGFEVVTSQNRVTAFDPKLWCP